MLAKLRIERRSSNLLTADEMNNKDAATTGLNTTKQ